MARGPAGTAGSAQRRGGTSLPRLAGALAVVALHVAVIYALVTGLAQRSVEIVRPPIETRILPPEQPTPPLVPPPPPPTLAPPPPLFVPPPVVRIAPPPPPARSNAVTVVTPVKPPEPAPPAAAPVVVAPPAPAPREPVRVQPRPDPAHPLDLESEYPAVSKRLGEAGTVTVQIMVTPDGRAGDVRLIEPSGFARLDEAALNIIRTKGRFLPGTVDGKPVTQWITFRFVWKLK